MAILNTLQHADTRLFRHVFEHGARRHGLVRLARVISHSGDGYLHLLLPLMFVGLDVDASPYLVLLGVAMSVERALYVMLKNTLKRQRPHDFLPGLRSLITASDKFSFPSGHSSAAFCLATVTGIVFGGPFLMLYLWASGVALSRVLLGVHFPGDIVAGALLGSSLAIVSADYLMML